MVHMDVEQRSKPMNLDILRPKKRIVHTIQKKIVVRKTWL